MATPKTVTNGVTSLNEAALNKYISGDGTKVQIKEYHATIVYSGGSIIVSSSYDSCGLVTGDLNYNATSDRLEITISGFTNAPVVQVTRFGGASSYVPAVYSATNTQIDIEFYDASDLTTAVTPGAEDANMNFTLFVIGY